MAACLKNMGFCPLGTKCIFFYKPYVYDDMSWSHDTTSVGVYGVFTDFGSNVIKGVISGINRKIFKNLLGAT